MHAIAAIAFLTTAIAASPQVKRLPPLDKITVEEAIDICRDDMTVYCCESFHNEKIGNVVRNDPKLPDGLGMGDECYKLDIDAVGFVNQLLNNECQANAACCQPNDPIVDDGDIGVSIPCVALSSML
ncbi:hydrophobin [Fusarium denticulatum]|uniref:Hydrophobin n=1 Tax=Fusarium denticulatum TaxID=48507 RepID=A0A8H5WK39_9HYPO|nr:hydrophobin [Fusarium denticulatum]